MRRPPAHAGGLRRPERLVIALVLLLIAALVGSLAFAAAHDGGRSGGAAGVASQRIARLSAITAGPGREARPQQY